MNESMWGDWLPKFVTELHEAEPTSEEKEILRKAAAIKAANKNRIDGIRRRYE